MNITCLTAHPDDELAAAGTLARWVDEGHDVRLFVCHVDELRAKELRASAEALGCKLDPMFWPDDFLSHDKVSVELLEGLIGEPDLLLSHRVEDDNTSHVPLARIARTLARKNRMGLWEIDAAIPGGLVTDGRANNCLVDISGYTVPKGYAIGAYLSQVKKYGAGWVDALLGRDSVNGWQCGVEDAEAFRIVKQVVL